MPAPVICSVCGACECILRRERCLQPTFCRVCGACGQKEDACNPRFAVPAVPATKMRMPATHIAVPAVPAAERRMLATHGLPCLRCLRRKRRCLQPPFYRVCGACDEKEDACNPRFTVPAVPATKGRMLATHVIPCLPCMRCLRRRGGFLRSKLRGRQM